VAVHGLDGLSAGLTQLFTGEETKSYSEKGIRNALQKAGVSKENADIYAVYGDAGISMALTAGSGALMKFAKAPVKAIPKAKIVPKVNNVPAAKGGTTVLGHYPAYTKLATELGARRFQIPTNVWNKMSAAEQWTANTKFLDRMILRGDNIRLATPLNQVKPGSFYQQELNFLFGKGYNVSSDGLWLVK
jgi:hypothetical protein